MYIFGTFIETFAVLFHYLISTYTWVVIIAVILSWINPSPNNDLVRNILMIIHKLTQPVFYWVRSKLPRAFFSSGLDLTPMIILLVLWGVDMFVTKSLLHIAFRLQGAP